MSPIPGRKQTQREKSPFEDGCLVGGIGYIPVEVRERMVKGLLREAPRAGVEGARNLVEGLANVVRHRRWFVLP